MIDTDVIVRFTKSVCRVGLIDYTNYIDIVVASWARHMVTADV